MVGQVGQRPLWFQIDILSRLKRIINGKIDQNLTKTSKTMDKGVPGVANEPF